MVNVGADQRFLVRQMHEKIFERLTPNFETFTLPSPKIVLSDIIEEYTSRIGAAHNGETAIKFLQ